MNPHPVRPDFPGVPPAADEKLSSLECWEGGVASGPAHMAADEAMLRVADRPILRWYRWARAEVTFGYPMRWRDVEAAAAGRPAVRRWTGGGIVEHGVDLTLAIAIPAADAEPPLVFYERVHRAISLSLESDARLAAPEECRCGPSCFENPARFDVLQNGKKVAGGAIRRCREGLLYQGSIQAERLPSGFGRRVAENLAHTVAAGIPPLAFQRLRDDLLQSRYTSGDWLRKR